jgi:hypothetical protein
LLNIIWFLEIAPPRYDVTITKWVCRVTINRKYMTIGRRTVRPICRPQQNQKLVFDGHKRFYRRKFQSIVIPNGLISHLYTDWGAPPWFWNVNGK